MHKNDDIQNLLTIVLAKGVSCLKIIHSIGYFDINMNFRSSKYSHCSVLNQSFEFNFHVFNIQIGVVASLNWLYFLDCHVSKWTQAGFVELFQWHSFVMLTSFQIFIPNRRYINWISYGYRFQYFDSFLQWNLHALMLVWWCHRFRGVHFRFCYFKNVKI